MISIVISGMSTLYEAFSAHGKSIENHSEKAQASPESHYQILFLIGRPKISKPPSGKVSACLKNQACWDCSKAVK